MSSSLFRRHREFTESRWTRSAKWTAMIAACLITSSCSSMKSTVKTNPGPADSVVQQSAQPGRISLDDTPEGVVTTYRAQSSPTRAAEQYPELPVPPIKQTGFDDQAACPPTTHVCEPREYVDTPGCPQDGMPCRSCRPAPTYAAMGQAPVEPEPLDYDDEYLCDGGDEGYPVHYHGLEMKGLETEDTVVEFYDNNNKRRVEPSNKVCVYAPRFAAVRSATAPIAGVQIAKAAGAHDGLGVGGFNSKLRVDENKHIDQLDTVRMRARASGLKKDQSDNVFDATQSATVHAKLVNLFEARKFIAEGQYVRDESPIISDGMAAAGVWSRDLNPVVSASDVSGQAVVTVTKVEAYTAVEDPRGPGQLRVVKLADKSVAEVGDTIEFTIRIDNLGGLELREVKLVDNLTPRLEYVEGSATHTLDGELLVEDNGEGSSKLTFRLAAPLKGKTGGVLKFRCVVR